MNTLYYGGGVCTIEGSNIIAVRIYYRGAIKIDDKSPSGFFISANSKRISVGPNKKSELSLNELFTYVGEFKILNAISVNRGTADRLYTTVKEVLDHSELIKSNAEDLTVKSEDLSTGRGFGKIVSKTILKQKTIENLNTSDNMNLIDDSGNKYQGYYHINIENKRIMSGGTYSGSSVNLKTISDPATSKLANDVRRAQRRRAWLTKT